MRRRHAARQPRDLCSGPAKLAAALAIDGSCDGLDLTHARGAVALFDDGTPPPTAPGVSRRIGISKATEKMWRWFVAGDPNVSKAPR